MQFVKMVADSKN